MEGTYVYFVTFTVIDWLPIFINPEPTQIIVDSLKFCVREKELRLNAYVLMPNHIHMIVFNKNFDNERLRKTLIDFRKFTGRKLAGYIENTLPKSLTSVIRTKQLTDRERQVWQPSWPAEGLISEKFWKQKMNYIHENPVRKGYVQLPEHWRYSSAGYWVVGAEGDIPVVSVQSEEK